MGVWSRIKTVAVHVGAGLAALTGSHGHLCTESAQRAIFVAKSISVNSLASLSFVDTASIALPATATPATASTTVTSKPAILVDSAVLAANNSSDLVAQCDRATVTATPATPATPAKDTSAHAAFTSSVTKNFVAALELHAVPVQVIELKKFEASSSLVQSLPDTINADTPAELDSIIVAQDPSPRDDNAPVVAAAPTRLLANNTEADVIVTATTRTTENLAVIELHASTATSTTIAITCNTSPSSTAAPTATESIEKLLELSAVFGQKFEPWTANVKAARTPDYTHLVSASEQDETVIASPLTLSSEEHGPAVNDSNITSAGSTQPNITITITTKEVNIKTITPAESGAIAAVTPVTSKDCANNKLDFVEDPEYAVAQATSGLNDQIVDETKVDDVQAEHEPAVMPQQDQLPRYEYATLPVKPGNINDSRSTFASNGAMEQNVAAETNLARPAGFESTCAASPRTVALIELSAALAQELESGSPVQVTTSGLGHLFAPSAANVQIAPVPSTDTGIVDGAHVAAHLAEPTATAVADVPEQCAAFSAMAANADLPPAKADPVPLELEARSENSTARKTAINLMYNLVADSTAAVDATTVPPVRGAASTVREYGPSKGPGFLAPGEAPPADYDPLIHGQGLYKRADQVPFIWSIYRDRGEPKRSAIKAPKWARKLGSRIARNASKSTESTESIPAAPQVAAAPLPRPRPRILDELAATPTMRAKLELMSRQGDHRADLTGRNSKYPMCRADEDAHYDGVFGMRRARDAGELEPYRKFLFQSEMDRPNTFVDALGLHLAEQPAALLPEAVVKRLLAITDQHPFAMAHHTVNIDADLTRWYPIPSHSVGSENLGEASQWAIRALNVRIAQAFAVKRDDGSGGVFDTQQQVDNAVEYFRYLNRIAAEWSWRYQLTTTAQELAAAAALHAMRVDARDVFAKDAWYNRVSYERQAFELANYLVCYFSNTH
ncbi:hypothetical protein H9P43_009759 [Blastocladiella emersonii ATCC 22665]|nr:hypothetical protein H9P43_009759 [Blastocladiella emersonii ATCC 22665]